MKTIQEPLSAELIQTIHTYIDENIRDTSLFFDIETTGLSPKSASVYLIGTAAVENGQWIMRQWFAESLAEEEAILEDFLNYARNYTALIHFNGTTFDIPFIQSRSKKYGLPAALTEMKQLDIYRSISPFKNVLKLSNCKQKTLEEFLGIFREDPFNGGQLIEFYHAYRHNNDPNLLHALLLHNADDIRGMLTILPILSYPDLFSRGITSAAASLESCTDYRGTQQKELILQMNFTVSVPVPFAFSKGGCFFSAGMENASAKIPVFQGELKYFYKDYKNYSYLPAEDNAIHKSVAVYVDKSHRVPATPETCYTRKAGEFIPCFCTKTELPVFHKCAAAKKKTASDAKTPECNDFLLLDDTFLQNPENVAAYGNSLLAYFLK